MNSSIAKAIFHLGVKNRNPSLWEEYDRLKETEWCSRSQLIDLQVDKARNFFRFASKHSKYYQSIFKRNGFNALEFGSIDDLKKIPMLSKELLIEKNQAIHTDYKFDRLFVAETSGTSGSALEFKKNERWDSTNRASMMRSYDWYDVKPWENNGYLWGYDIAKSEALKVKLFDLLQNRFRVFNYDSDSIRNFSKRLVNASFVTGYSSMIYEAAKLINEMGLDKPNLKLVKGTSEMILDVYQPEVIKAFGHKMVSEYGAAESGLIAFECPEGSMHINMENVLVEVDEEGEVVVTNLASYSFPIIRYKLGDSIKLSDEVCKCGRAHTVISEIAGRKGSLVVGNNNKYPALTFYYVFKNLAKQKSILLNYKAVQDERGRVKLYIEGANNKRYKSVIFEELVKYFEYDIEFSVEFVQRFTSQRKKTQYFESTL